LSNSKHRSIGQREKATHNSHCNVTPLRPGTMLDTKYLTSSGSSTLRATISV
jgi:hypothetical protein